MFRATTHRLHAVRAKHLVFGLTFALAMVASAGLGLSSRQPANAVPLAGNEKSDSEIVTQVMGTMPDTTPGTAVMGSTNTSGLIGH